MQFVERVGFGEDGVAQGARFVTAWNTEPEAAQALARAIAGL